MIIKGTRKCDDNLPSISILIPTYNSGKYIERTLQSIFAQKYSGKIEIIIGYDTKSTDDTLEKIQNIESPYDIIIDSDNDSSLGAGRNRIFKFATGDFVYHMDSDDLVIDTLVQNVIRLFMRHPELNVVTYNTKCVSEKEAEKCYQTYCGAEDSKYEIMNSADVMHAWWLSGKCIVCVWGYIYRREFLIDNNVVSPDYTSGEDLTFLLRCFLSTDKVGFLKMIGYVYIFHENSSCNAPRTAERFWDDHKEWREDYFKLTADKYPAFFSIAYIDYLKFYVYKCALSDYDTFCKKLDERYIRKIPVVFGGSLVGAGSFLLFNLSRRLFWICAHIKSKITS